ncbi:MAG: glycosyltransferase, partial [Pseudomonadota bacterium]
MTRVSAIVVSYQTGPRLKECLYALVSDPEVDELILVDNGNPLEMTAWIDAFAGKRGTVRVIRGHGNIGFGAGINLGARAAEGEAYLVINPDAALRRGSVSSLQNAAEGLEAPWIIGGKIFDIQGHEERGPRRRDLTLWRALTT